MPVLESTQIVFNYVRDSRDCLMVDEGGEYKERILKVAQQTQFFDYGNLDYCMRPRLTCQPARHPMGQAKQGPALEGL